MKVSVIIPVYGVEKYLNAFLNSLIRQDFQDCEFILINDCSPDNSDQIIKSYLSKDDRFIYLNKDVNEGEMNARQDGLLLAKGEYIINIDSDDYISNNFISSLYSHAKLYDLDMCISNVMLHNELTSKVYTHGKFFKRNLVFNKNTISSVLCLPYSTWCRLIKKSVFTKYNYSYLNGETNLTRIQFLKNIKCGLAGDAIYYYRQRSDSLSSFTNSKNKYKKNYSLTDIDKLYSLDLEIFNLEEMSEEFRIFRYTHTLKLIIISFIKTGSLSNYIQTENHLKKVYRIKRIHFLKFCLYFGKKDSLFTLFSLMKLSPLILLVYKLKSKWLS